MNLMLLFFAKTTFKLQGERLCVARGGAIHVFSTSSNSEIDNYEIEFGESYHSKALVQFPAACC